MDTLYDTWKPGLRSKRAKLTCDQARDVFNRLISGQSTKQISDETGVSYGAIWKIKNKSSYADCTKGMRL